MNYKAAVVTSFPNKEFETYAKRMLQSLRILSCRDTGCWLAWMMISSAPDVTKLIREQDAVAVLNAPDS